MSLRKNDDSLPEKVAKIIFSVLWQKYEEVEYARVCLAPSRLFSKIEQALQKRSAPGVMRDIPGPEIATRLANLIFKELLTFGISKKDMLFTFSEMQTEVADLIKIKHENQEAPVSRELRRHYNTVL